MGCLSNLIGIKRNCTDSEPSSGLYINSLKGVRLQIAEDAMSEEDSSAVAFIQGRIDHAVELMKQDVRTFLAPKMRAKSLIDNDTVGKYTEDLEVKAAEAGKYKGILVEINKYDYASFHLASLKLKLDGAISTNVYVIDLMTDTILDTLPITTVDKKDTEIVVNKTYPVKQQRLQLLIAIDSEVADQYEADINADCNTCDNAYQNWMVKFQSVELSKSDAKIKGNTSTIKHTGGLSISYSVNCDIEPFLCNMSNLLAMPLLHKAGAELMGELMVSDRINSTVVIYADNIEALAQEFEEKYASMMNQLLDNVALPEGTCFECRKVVQHVVRKP